MPAFCNKIFISADFRPKCFCSKSAEMKILLCKMGMGITLYEIIFFSIYVLKNLGLCSKFTSKKEVL